MKVITKKFLSVPEFTMCHLNWLFWQQDWNCKYVQPHENHFDTSIWESRQFLKFSFQTGQGYIVIIRIWLEFSTLDSATSTARRSIQRTILGHAFSNMSETEVFVIGPVEAHHSFCLISVSNFLRVDEKRKIFSTLGNMLLSGNYAWDTMAVIPQSLATPSGKQVSLWKEKSLNWQQHDGTSQTTGTVVQMT